MNDWMEVNSVVLNVLTAVMWLAMIFTFGCCLGWTLGRRASRLKIKRLQKVINREYTASGTYAEGGKDD